MRAGSETYPTHIKGELDQRHTALLVVDMQYHDAHPDFGFCLGMERVAPGSMQYYSARLEATTVPSIKSLLQLFRSNGLKIIYLLLGSDKEDYADLNPRLRKWQIQFERDTGIRGMMWKNSPLYRIREELSPKANELVLMKRTFGAFASTNLDQILRGANIESLVVTGVTTSCCPETTAREASDRGYSTILVDDATADIDEQRHRASLESFKFNFGGVLRNEKEVRSSLSL